MQFRASGSEISGGGVMDLYWAASMTCMMLRQAWREKVGMTCRRVGMIASDS